MTINKDEIFFGLLTPNQPCQLKRCCQLGHCPQETTLSSKPIQLSPLRTETPVDFLHMFLLFSKNTFFWCSYSLGRILSPQVLAPQGERRCLCSGDPRPILQILLRQEVQDIGAQDRRDRWDCPRPRFCALASLNQHVERCADHEKISRWRRSGEKLSDCEWMSSFFPLFEVK